MTKIFEEHFGWGYLVNRIYEEYSNCPCYRIFNWNDIMQLSKWQFCKKLYKNNYFGEKSYNKGLFRYKSYSKDHFVEKKQLQLTFWWKILKQGALRWIWDDSGILGGILVIFARISSWIIEIHEQSQKNWSTSQTIALN